MSNRVRVPLGAALVFFGIALCAQRGVLASLDGNVYWKVTQSLVHRRSLTPILPPEWDQLHIHTPYSSFGIGMSLYLMPFVWIQDKIDPNGQGIVTLANPVMLAICIALLCTILQRLRVRDSVAAFGGLAFGLATTALFQSTEGFSEPGVTACVLIATLGILLWREDRAIGPWLIGCGLSAAVLFRLDSLVTIVPLGLAVPCVVPWSTLKRKMWASGVALLIPFLLVMAWTGWYNNLRYGSPLTGGYPGQGFTNPILWGLDLLVISPGKGLFWYAPAVLLGVVGIRASWRRERWLTAAVAALFIGRILFYARWNSPEGGVGWGPRFMLPIYALALIPAALWLDRLLDCPRAKRRIPLVFVGFILACGLLVNLLSVWVPYEQYVNDIRIAAAGETQVDVDRRLNQYIHDIPASHIVGNWDRLDHARPFPLRQFDGGPNAIAFLAVGIALTGCGLLRASRTRQAHTT